MYQLHSSESGREEKGKGAENIFHHPGILVSDGTGAWSGIVYIPKTVPFALYE